MNRFGRIVAAVGILSIFAMAGWGDAAPSWTSTRDQAAVVVHWPQGCQNPGKIQLTGARNETICLSMVVEGNCPTLRARAEGLPTGAEGQFFRVMAAPSTSAANYPSDALLPLEENFPAAATTPMHLWLSLKVAPACKPGDYALKLVFTSGGESLGLPVDLKVFRFTLPEDLPITILGGFWLQPGYGDRYFKGSLSGSAALIKKYYASIRDHKFNALGGSYPLPLGQIEAQQPIEDFPDYHDLLKYVLDDLKFRYVQIPKLRNWQSISGPNDDFSRQARRFYPCYGDYLRHHGWESRALNYLVDEPRPSQYDGVIQAYTLVKSLCPGIKTLCAGRRPPPGSAQVIDMWAYQAGSYQEPVRQQAQHPGQEAWLYINRLQGINHPLAHQRLIGWLLYRYQFSGFLLWGVNYWPQDPWTTPPGPKDFFRRGTFYYPHPRTGLPVPTTRLEALRRGFEDYQYLVLLDQACRRGLVPPEKQQYILAKVHHFTEDLPRSSFSVSMADIEDLRTYIGDILDAAAGPEEMHANTPADRSDVFIHKEGAAR